MARPLRIDLPNGWYHVTVRGRRTEVLEVLDAMRWLERVGYHTWRISNYLGGAGKPETVAPAL
jgi:hypothetical protein